MLSQSKHKGRKSPKTELESQMLAEEEMQSIYSQSTYANSYCTNTQSQLWGLSPAKVDQTDGFSNFGHFRAPIKRPSCNPLLKDDIFKRINSCDEVLPPGIGSQEEMTTCLSQDQIFFCNEYSGMDYVAFPFSQRTSPTSVSGMTLFSAKDNQIQHNIDVGDSAQEFELQF